jgi:hypothetical protein
MVMVLLLVPVRGETRVKQTKKPGSWPGSDQRHAGRTRESYPAGMKAFGRRAREVMPAAMRALVKPSTRSARFVIGR